MGVWKSIAYVAVSGEKMERREFSIFLVGNLIILAEREMYLLCGAFAQGYSLTGGFVL